MTNEKEYEDMTLEELETEMKKVFVQKLSNLEKDKNDTDIQAEPKLSVNVSMSKDASDNSEYAWIVKTGVKDYANAFNFTDADANCPTDYSDWTVSEWFSNYIIQAAASDCPLLSSVRMKVELGAGNGTVVKFRKIDARTPSALGSGECMSCASNSITVSSVTVARFGDYCVINSFEDWASKDTKEAVLQSMGLGAGRYINSEINDAITESTPGTTEDMNAVFTLSNQLSGSCCTNSDGYNLYVAFVDLITAMDAKGYNCQKNGLILLHPTVAATLKYPSEADVPFWMRGSTDVKDGKLVKLLGVDVLEDSLMPIAAVTADTAFAYIIMKNQSLGLVWGKHPTFNQKYDGICDAWDLTYNSYFGVDSISDESIGQIRSP